MKRKVRAAVHVTRTIAKRRLAAHQQAEQEGKAERSKLKKFLIRAGILLLAVMAILIVAFNTGEVISLSVAFPHIAEALGAAAADTFAEDGV